MLRLRGLVTTHDFSDKVSEEKNGAAAKPAPKWRARRVGEPLTLIDTPAAKSQANRGHAQPQDQEPGNAEGSITLPKKQPLVLTEPGLPLAMGMVQEMRLTCMLATKVVVSVFGFERVCTRGPPRQCDAK